jgi:hypothetical protein
VEAEAVRVEAEEETLKFLPLPYHCTKRIGANVMMNKEEKWVIMLGAELFGILLEGVVAVRSRVGDWRLGSSWAED